MRSTLIGLARAGRDDVGQQARGLVLVDLALVDGGERLDACQRALQLADVALDLVRDEAEDLLR